MVIDLIPNLKLASIEPGQSEPVTFGDFVIPSEFSAWFVFDDPNSGKEWDLFMQITVSEFGTPIISELTIKGLRSSNLLETKRFGVDRFQIKISEQYRAQLFNLALRSAVETRWPTVMLRREYSLENAALLRAMTQIGHKPNEVVLEHPSTIKGKMPNGEVADFVRFWDGRPEPLDAKELRNLQQLIGIKTRQKITGELLSEVAAIYNEEGSRIGGKPVKAIQNHFHCSYRTAQDYVRKAREAKLLPQAVIGKVTVSKPKARKENK